MSIMKEFSKGIIKENAVFRLLLGLCPTLAVTGLAENGFGMGLATTAVLVASNLVISLLKGVIPSKIRIPIFIIVIATFVTMVDMVLNAYMPVLHSQLGIFVPLIVVNCLVLGRAEAFASKQPVIHSLADGLGMGLGFTLALTILAAVRELLAQGTIFQIEILGADWYQPFQVFGSPAGAFLALGLLLAVMSALSAKFKLE
ncbi:electron transport complex subunit RsxE [Dethiobacter alkaliphilus]|uniref:Ion-translocating oxidoreductase complex subunit E n=1 Tax=Dethiobacter alkaliphilus AHT 1 TaxID=555088 RepID=C0GEY2_DETAL|nr:electron transport complex subunit RsxE [Dethiobacter alkaliphilus]EEG78164.1 electron transport complex, RnfABCDGE type, E subunit [Dethiobacter alkaliphilus AHT 1]